MIRVLTAFAGALLLSNPATAAVFTFTQGGYADGATVTGSFAGSDLNHDGEISLYDGEVSAFSADFSGNTILGALHFGYGDLNGLVYDGDGLLGDGTTGELEGLVANGASAAFGIGTGAYATCDGVSQCAYISDGVNADFSSQGLAVTTSAVPEPTTWTMLILGFAVIAARGRFKGESRNHPLSIGQLPRANG